MSLQVSVNLNGINMIRDQLVETATQAASEFELFVADQSNTSNLESAEEGVRQLAGIYKLLEFEGAAMLCAEMAELACYIGELPEEKREAKIQVFTDNLFLLPRYIEFVTVEQSRLPTLLLPAINAMRIARRQPLLPEYHFADTGLPGVLPPIQGDAGEGIETLATTASRLRHMYQTGLLAVIRSDGDDLHHYTLLLRPLDRLLALMGDHSKVAFWRLAQAFVQALSEGFLGLNINRKRLLGDIEKRLRAIQSQGLAALDEDPAPELVKSLFFSLSLCPAKSEGRAIADSFGVSPAQMDDIELRALAEAMAGPSLDTMASVIKVLKEELRQARDILEIGAQNDGMIDEDRDSLAELLARVGDTLCLLNLSGPQRLLIDEFDALQNWPEEGGSVGNRPLFLNTADLMLFIDSALSALQRRDLTVEQINEADETRRAEIVAQSQLNQAKKIVLEEAESGIALAKRAITAYVDSNFDGAHISNVATTLNTLRGGLSVLNYRRAAAILVSCGAFIEHHIQDNSSDQRHQLLATLADALISLEYYLAELAANAAADEKILEVAEESLAALGFQVEPA